MLAAAHAAPLDSAALSFKPYVAERIAESRKAAESLRERGGRALLVPLLKAAEPWSLFNPTIRDAHRQALRQATKAGTDPRLVARPRFDND